MPSKKLTDEMYGHIPVLIAAGKSKDDIAAAYGVTTNTLQVLCSRRGISLRRGGRRGPCRVLSLPELPLGLSKTALIALREKAQAMGVDEAQLARDLLEHIVRDDLYDAVLDTNKAVA